MTDDLVDRLESLAPHVDSRSAFDAVKRRGKRRRRDRRTLMVGAALVVIVGGATVTSAALNDEGTHVLSDAHGPPGDPASATTTKRGLEVTVTVPSGELVLGEATEVEVVVRNVGDRADDMLVNFGHCNGPGQLEASGLWADPMTDEAWHERFWDGTSPLAMHLLGHDGLGAPQLQDPATVDVPFLACTTDVTYTPLSPGEEVTWNGVVVTRVGPHAVPSSMRLAVSVDARSGTASTGLDLPVVDSDERMSSAGDALTALTSDPRVTAYIEELPPEATAAALEEPAFGWAPALTWRSGQWELTLNHIGLTSSLVARFDPVEGAVVEVVVTRELPDGAGYAEEELDLP